MRLGNWTHELEHHEGGKFLARLDKDGRKMYVSDVVDPDGRLINPATTYACNAASVEDNFSSPEGWWKCTKLNKFKGNK